MKCHNRLIKCKNHPNRPDKHETKTLWLIVWTIFTTEGQVDYAHV